MRDINEITSFLTSERENRDYIEGRIQHWEAKLNDVTPGTSNHSFIVHRLVSLELQLSDAKRCITLLKIERAAVLVA